MIRRLTAADADAYRTIRLEGLELAPAAFGTTFEREAEQPIAWFVERLANNTILAALDATGLLGVAGLYSVASPKERHKGVLFGMYVRPAARGRGVAGELVQGVLDHAAGVVEQVQLTVEAGNVSARRLYSRFGFTDWAVERQALKYRGVYYDEVWMVKFLAA